MAYLVKALISRLLYLKNLGKYRVVCRGGYLSGRMCPCFWRVIKQYQIMHPKYDGCLFGNLGWVTGILLYKACETGQLMHGWPVWYVQVRSYIEVTKDATVIFVRMDKPVSTTTSRYGGNKEYNMDNSIVITVVFDDHPHIWWRKRTNAADWKYTDNAQDREFMGLIGYVPGKLIIVAVFFKGFTVQDNPSL